MEKISLCPQFIFKFECSDEQLILNGYSNLRKEEWVKNTNNFFTKNSRLEKDNNYENLVQWFDSCLDQVQQELKLQCDRLKIVQMWGNCSRFEQWHHPHVHHNSLISGIFYLVDSNSCTWFSVDNIWNLRTNSLGLKLDFDDKNFTRVIHKEKTIRGNLLIFPSYFYHSVDENRDVDNDRYTISFNTFPCGKIGSYEKAQGLEIDIK